MMDGRNVTLRHFLGWLKRQPPKTRYHYVDSVDCVLCRYLRGVGLPVESVTIVGWLGRDGKRRRPHDWDAMCRATNNDWWDTADRRGPETYKLAAKYAQRELRKTRNAPTD